MSGTALTTISPSRLRTRRRVVCVAGCCGPKLSVQRYSLSNPSGGAMASARCSGMTALREGPSTKYQGRKCCSLSLVLSTWSLTFGAGDDREVVALAVAAHRVVLAHRVSGKLFRHQDAAQVGVALEDDAVHVVDLALHPVGAFPQRRDRRQPRVGVVDPRLDDQLVSGGDVGQHVPDAVAVA